MDPPMRASWQTVGTGPRFGVGFVCLRKRGFHLRASLALTKASFRKGPKLKIEGYVASVGRFSNVRAASVAAGSLRSVRAPRSWES